MTEAPPHLDSAALPRNGDPAEAPPQAEPIALEPGPESAPESASLPSDSEQVEPVAPVEPKAVAASVPVIAKPRPPLLGNFAFYTLLAAFIALGLWPVWCTDLLPVVDNQSHMHLIKLMHDWNSNPLFQKYYVKVDAIVPYLSYYKAVHWMAYFGSVEWANRVVLSICLALLPISALTLIRAAGHNRWLVLGVLPWMLNADFVMGFFNFLMSIPVFLFLLAAHLRLLQQPKWWRAALVAGLLMFMAITHYLLWAVSLALLPTLALLFGIRHGWRRALWWPLRELFLGLPSIGLLMPWFLSYFVFADSVLTPDQAGTVAKGTFLERLQHVYTGDHLGPVDNLRQLLESMFDRISPTNAPATLLARPGQLVDTLWLAGMLLWVLAAAREPLWSKVAPRLPSPRRIVISGSSYTGWVFVLVTTAYFVMPRHLIRPIWLWGVNFRLVEVIGVLAVCALPLHPLAPQKAVRGRVLAGTLALLAAAIAMPVLTAGQFALARTEYGTIREAMASIPTGKKVLVLRKKFDSRFVRATLFNGITEWYTVLRGGYVPYSFADTSSKPFVANKKTQLPAPPWDYHDAFSWDQHGKYYDYVVLFNEPGAPRAAYEAELPLNLVRVYQHDMWRVYKNPNPLKFP